MYIRIGHTKTDCTDFNISPKGDTVMFYLTNKPTLSTNKINLYDTTNFLMKTIDKTQYKYKTITPFGDQFILTLTNTELVEDVVNIDELKQNKIKELSSIIQKNIIDGFDLDINGKIKHFSLKLEDQHNINSICLYLLSYMNVDGFIYHADGESDNVYSREDIFKIRDKMLETISENTSKFHKLRDKINKCKTIKELDKIKF